jgi:hypothetical protein
VGINLLAKLVVLKRSNIFVPGKVKLMKTFLTTRSIRNSLISAAAVSALTVPLMAVASLKVDDGFEIKNKTGGPGSLNDQTSFRQEESPGEQVNLYQRLKIASRRLCGSSSHRITRSLAQSMSNAECYDESLATAVERLGNPAVTELHNN